MVCHSHLQWTTFCQTSPPWPVCLGWLPKAWLSFTELDKVVVRVTDLLVVCDCSFSLSSRWCPLLMPTILLGFLLPWTWGLSSWLLQESAAAAAYLRSRVAPLSCHPWSWTWGSCSPLHFCVLPLQLPCFCTPIAAVANNNSTTYSSWYCFCYCDRIVCMLIRKSKTIIKTNILR